MVFQDGGGFLDPDDEMRAAVVLDNLVADGAIPPLVGVFVDPGDRNAEYDAADATYADFLLDEVLPRVGEVVPISGRPQDRALCGFSSGGSAAFTAAWHRPDAFGKVIGLSSSFPQVHGTPFPRAIMDEPVRDLRVFLQVGHRDLGWDEPDDNWLAANLEVAATLLRRGYDVRLVLGTAATTATTAVSCCPTRCAGLALTSAEPADLVGPDGRGDDLAARVGERRLEHELPLAGRQRVVPHPRHLVVGQRRRGAYDAQRGPPEPDRRLLDERHEARELAVEVEGREGQDAAEHLGHAVERAGVRHAEVVDVGLRRQLRDRTAGGDLDEADAHGLQDRHGPDSCLHSQRIGHPGACRKAPWCRTLHGVMPHDTAPFALPAALAAKTDPALIDQDRAHFRAIATSLEHAIAELEESLAETRKGTARHGTAALDRDQEVHRQTARLRALRRFDLDLCLGRIVHDGPRRNPTYVGRFGSPTPTAGGCSSTGARPRPSRSSPPPTRSRTGS